MSTVDEAIAAVRAGDPVVLPFDTVYGLAARPDVESTRRLYALKGRALEQPTALVAYDAQGLVDLIPGLETELLLRGPFTLIVPNPQRRLPWLTGTNPETIGVRLPELTGAAAAVLAAIRVLAATSANHPGGPDPASFDEVPEEIRTGAGAAIDGGDLPGTPSTVVDLTRPEPRVVREGLVSAAETLRRLEAAVRST
jgi:L-threonylcarbamoyladenylate synthase